MYIALITYITLHYITLHYITLHYITLHYITLHYITLHYIALHYITLHYITLHYITLHYITLHYITLHYITLHYIHARTYAYILHIYTYAYIWVVVKIMVPLGPLNTRCRIILRTRKGTLILTTTHMPLCIWTADSAPILGTPLVWIREMPGSRPFVGPAALRPRGRPGRPTSSGVPKHLGSRRLPGPSKTTEI